MSRVKEHAGIRICPPQSVPHVRKLPEVELDALVMHSVKLVAVVVYATGIKISICTHLSGRIDGEMTYEAGMSRCW
jgi:hypothetical protein